MSDSGEKPLRTKNSRKIIDESLSQSSLNTLKVKLREREMDIEDLHDKVTDLRLASNRRERTLQKEIDRRKDEIEELTNELKCETKSHFKYKTRMKQLEKKVQELMKQTERREDNEVSKTRVDSFNSDVISLTDLTNQLQVEKENLMTKLSHAKREKEDIENELNSKIEEYLITIQNLESENYNLKRDLEEFKRKTEIERDRNDELNAVIGRQELSIDEHENTIHKLEKELQDCQNKITGMLLPQTSPTSSTSDEEMAMCPNCAEYISMAEIDQHLNRCLDEY